MKEKWEKVTLYCLQILRISMIPMISAISPVAVLLKAITNPRLTLPRPVKFCNIKRTGTRKINTLQKLMVSVIFVFPKPYKRARTEELIPRGMAP